MIALQGKSVKALTCTTEEPYYSSFLVHYW